MDQQKYIDLLCCPECKGGLDWQANEKELHCPVCQYTFPIVDGIPILFPCNVKDEMSKLFQRYWDSEKKADLYDRYVEGKESIFGTYNHKSEVYGLTTHFDPQKLDVVLDAGCGNGRFMEALPAESVKIGLDASLNLLKITKRLNRGDFLVCGELEHLPFKDSTFSTVISCRVLQHLHDQERACHEMSRVVRDGGDVILELYNTWNLKTIYKNIRMSARLRRIFNAPFRLLFKSMSPFDDWGLTYDRYNNWFQVKSWMQRAGLSNIKGRGVGFGYHKYLFDPFYINAVLVKKAPRLLTRYYDGCFSTEKIIGGLVPLRYTMEKFVIKGVKNAANSRYAAHWQSRK